MEVEVVEGLESFGAGMMGILGIGVDQSEEWGHGPAVEGSARIGGVVVEKVEGCAD